MRGWAADGQPVAGCSCGNWSTSLVMSPENGVSFQIPKRRENFDKKLFSWWNISVMISKTVLCFFALVITLQNEQVSWKICIN